VAASDDPMARRHWKQQASEDPEPSGDEPVPSYRSVLRLRGYPSLLGAQAVSRIGDSVHYVALVALIFSLTGSGLAVSVAVVFEAVPVLLFGAVAGALVDRYPRRRVMVAADLVRCGLALIMALATSLPVIYALAFGLALGGVFYGPAYQALLPALVPGRVLGRANALSWSTVQSSHVLGAALGGGAVAVLGASGAFVVNAVTFLASALALLRVPEPPSSGAPAEHSSLRREAGEGLRVIRRDPFVRGLLGVQLLAVLSVGGTGALLVVLAQEQLGLDTAAFGWLVAAVGMGAFIGPLLFGRLVDRTDSATLIFIPYLVRGIVDAALAFLTGFWLPALLLLLYGVSTSTGGVAYTTLLQRRVPPDYRGRVFAAFTMVWQGGRLASLMLAGFVVDVFSIEVLYVSAGALLLLAGLIGLRLAPSAIGSMPGPPGLAR
jgi:MFS family permease